MIFKEKNLKLQTRLQTRLQTIGYNYLAIITDNSLIVILKEIMVKNIYELSSKV